MIKIAGFIAVIISTSLIGMTLSENITKRYSQLRNVIRMLSEFKTRLEYHLPTREELFSYVFSKNEFKLFESRNLHLTKLNDNEKQLLTDFYNQLGSSDLQSQLSSIEIYIKDFEKELSELAAIKDNRCRLLSTGGVLSGFFICLLLV
ncbi:MAG: hypothetical protein E7509_04600 [Ruminococcus sp.]|nr:hypothetical protein [Ruminococcus sp.]